jgi:hypothetical protein
VSQTAASGQLRVLSGWHQGACVPLLTAVGELSVGSALDNDVVLRDAPFAQALVVWKNETWCLQQDSNSLELTIGQALAWQDLHLTIDLSTASWAYLDAQTWPHSPQAVDTPALNDADSQTTLGNTTALPMPNPDTQSTRRGKPALRDASWLRHSSRWVLVGLCGMLTFAAVAAWTQMQAVSPAPMQPPALALDMPAMPAIDQSQLQAVIDQAGLTNVVRVEKVDGQRHALWGVVDDQDQLESLLRDVMVLTRKVIPHVLLQSEFEAQVKSLQDQLPLSILITADAGGKVWLSSESGEGAEMEAAITRVKEALPQAVQVRTGAAKSRPAAKPLSDVVALPSVVAFQSGPQAYVLLANGERILPGGQINRLRLIRIEDQTLVLEDAAGQSRRFER